MINLTLAQIAYIYNAGYNKGHDDTVEGWASPAFGESEMEDHHMEEIRDFLTDDMDISLDDVTKENN